ncbi:MAG: hypothetical protein LBL74_03045 [Bacteroidales bacterium]|nr:hypothetical protein [Bacteroidales bacterium]
MKKTFTLALCFALLVFGNLYAQDATDVAAEQTFPEENPLKDLKPYYVRLQYVNTLGESADFYGNGFGAEFGRNFYFKTKLFGLIVPGIDITFAEFAIAFGDRYNYNEHYDSNTAVIYRNGTRANFYTDDGFLSTVGVKIGPVFSYNIVDELYADLYFKYAPAFVWGGRRVYFEEMSNSHNVIDKDFSMSAGFAHRFSTGLNIKYNRFSFGLEFIFGSTTLHYAADIMPKQTGNGWNLTDERRMGLNTLKINIAYLF